MCEALREAGRDGKVRVIAYDVTPQNIDELRQGTISILIDQTAREQGSRPLMLLRDFILYGRRPEHSFCYTQNIDELRQGTISILIDQTAREQGSRPLMLLRDFILYGRRPEHSFCYTGITLKTRYNL